MEALEQGCKLYCKAHHHQESLTDEDRCRLKSDIERFIRIGTKEVTAQNLFGNKEFLMILKYALKQQEAENCDVLAVGRAFSNLEKYILLLIEQPWKPEFKVIKMYGGFFRTKIKSILPDCERIFHLAGYVTDQANCLLAYKTPVKSKQSLLLLAFDCRVACVECVAIADHYNKGKALSLTLNDAVANILHEEWSRDKPSINNNNFKFENGLAMDSSRNVSVGLPPALPKREPILSNGSTLIHNTKMDPMYTTSANPAVYAPYPNCAVYPDAQSNLLQRPYTAGTPSSRNLLRPSNDYYLTLPKSSPTSKVIPEAFSYMDEEILAEHPQATCEEHMRESLKLVNQQEVPKQPLSSTSSLTTKDDIGHRMEDWKWLRDLQVSGGIPLTSHNNACNFVTARTYNSNFGRGDHSIDEGIEQDMSNSVRSASLTPAANKLSFVTPSYDLGYRTGPHPDSSYNSQLSQILQNPATIYHPPITTDGIGGSTAYGMIPPQVRAYPPPVPSRALKPRPLKGDDDIDGKNLLASQFAASSESPLTVRSPTQLGVFLTPAPQSTLCLATKNQVSSTDPVLRRDRLPVGKSKSLKYGDPAHSVLQQVASARTVRSMDMTLTQWQCKACTALNVASDMTCSVCTHSRHGPAGSQPVYGQTKKSCPGCTFENEPAKENCEMCGSKLQDRFTYV